MKAMLLKAIANLDYNKVPLTMTDVPVLMPSAGEVLIKVLACGVCHTELDIIERRTPPAWSFVGRRYCRHAGRKD